MNITIQVIGTILTLWILFNTILLVVAHRRIDKLEKRVWELEQNMWPVK